MLILTNFLEFVIDFYQIAKKSLKKLSFFSSINGQNCESDETVFNTGNEIGVFFCDWVDFDVVK